MITLDQAKTLQRGQVIYQIYSPVKHDKDSKLIILPCGNQVYTLSRKPYSWRINGQLKLWRRDLSRFRLPLKYGLYGFGEITNENNYLFSLTSHLED